MTPSTRRFRTRSFTSLVVATGFVMLLLSGGVLLVSPPGRVANWTRWEMLGLTKHGWSDLHITFAALFLLAATAHVVFNWRPLLQHLGATLSRPRPWRWEGVAALFLGLAVFAGTRAHLPPFSTLLAWSESQRESWDTPQDRAPIPHAELLTLREITKEAGITLDDAIQRLTRSGILNPSPDAEIRALAESAHVAPARIFELLRTHPDSTTAPPARSGPGSGGGPGRKTLKQFCAEEGIDLRIAEERLARRGVKASPDQTLREIAVNNGHDRPYVLLEILRGE
ncbi:MAG: DUF4405 domain-containing protein [Verrucomicrobiales bacterium]|nr:DUF4405 domain-containing protein [Verrucomicrobiales bacterium]